MRGGLQALVEAASGARSCPPCRGPPALSPRSVAPGGLVPGGRQGPGTHDPSLSPSMEMCDQRHNITMCPLCDKTCSYWRMSSACATARASHLFDNPATVFFSIFMALWGKRSSAGPSRALGGLGGVAASSPSS